MKFENVIQKQDLITDWFYVFCDKYNELHWGDSVEDIKKKILDTYGDDIARNESGKEISMEEFTEYVDNIKEEDLEKIEIKIKRPSYSENGIILENSTRLEAGIPTIDYIEYNKHRILVLLKEWNLEKDGKPISVNQVSIGSLHPSVIDGILDKINKHIPHYLRTIIA